MKRNKQNAHIYSTKCNLFYIKKTVNKIKNISKMKTIRLDTFWYAYRMTLILTQL